MKVIKWGVLGPGKIARSFANDLQLVENTKLTAVASRDKQRAKSFALEYNIPNVYADYEALFCSNEVDVIYVATPHVFHKNLAIRAMEHGKHVLCEKPLGINKVEVEEMIRTAKAQKVFLMEALWSRFNPTILKIKQLVDKNILGELTYVNADFAFYALDRPLDSRLFNLDLAGGTLLDIGIYPVFLAYLFLGMPKNIKAVSNFNDIGTEIQTSIIFQYNNAQAILNSSFTHNSRMSAEIAGTKGNITLMPRFHESRGYILATDKIQEKTDVSLLGRGYSYEIIEVNQCIRNNKIESSLWTFKDSLNLISLLDEVRRISGVRFPFEEAR